MKSYYKYELARLAGVSTKTFSRWLRKHEEHLTAMGVTSRTKLLPPKAVRYLSEEFCIDLPG